LNLASGKADLLIFLDQPIVQTLMVPLQVVMRQERYGGCSQRTLSEEDHPLQAIALEANLAPGRIFSGHAQD
jgi:hypothetical protein